MAAHLDPNDPRYRDLATAILRRYDNNEAEANIASAVRDFLILTGLANADDIVEENPPSDDSRRAVDLTALDTFVEFKRRIGTAAGFNPDPDNVSQIDEYLEISKCAGKGVRTGILTDGKYWLLRWPEAGPVRTERPYGFVLDSPDRWLPLFEWLRDSALLSLDNIPADRANIERFLGPASPTYQRDIDTLTALYRDATGNETIRVKRRLWEDLLRAALGEVAGTSDALDDLFVRHTYLSAVIGIAVQASFGIDIHHLAANDPNDLIQGRRLNNSTGLSGIVESDFFAWPTEVSSGVGFLRSMARRIKRFNWRNAPADSAAILYETVIPPEERRQLGEYYTPRWLADAMVEELVTDPLNQRVLDPACGSGTFVVSAVNHYAGAARLAGLEPKATLDGLRGAVTGIDVHPAAVHLARAAWAFAARDVIAAASDYHAEVSAPIYLGDALQLRYRTGDMFAEHTVTVETREPDNPTLAFPMTLVERAETFDALLDDIAVAIERGDDPLLALDDHDIADPAERRLLEQTIATMARLHDEGRNHIWAYYTRNMVRPIALSRSKVDVIIGNPPWLNYNQTADVLRTELERQSKNSYGIWVGGRYASNQDLAGLFFARGVDLYLKDGGAIGMVLPHSALQSGQYTKWRTGDWQSQPAGRGRNRVAGRTLAVDFGHKSAWDLEPLEPNNFFPMASCVVFAERVSENGVAVALAGSVECWQGQTGTKDVQRLPRGITATSVGVESLYAAYARQGAPIRPRRLFFVEETENPTVIPAASSVTVNPRRGSQDREPWRNLDLTTITEQTIESRHVYDVYLNETLVPYATLAPLKVVLPVRKGEFQLPLDDRGPGGVSLAGLERRMRDRWQAISRMWEENKSAASRLNLVENLDHYRKLSSQLEWQRETHARPVRIVQSQGGQPTAALVQDDGALVDEALYWIACKNIQEADYLLAIINSQTLYEAVKPLMSKGQFGARNLHKQLWRLPIPECDDGIPLHREIAEAGVAAALGASERLTQLRAERSDRLTVTIARRELRAWLRESAEGRAVERLVSKLLANASLR